MKPTEADIQAELDRHGLNSWSITKQYDHPDNFYFWIEKSDSVGVYVFNTSRSIDFGIEDNDLYLSVDYTDFLTGNYDLSAISQHYDPEEWQRIITMCERIVRLITGEQVEQSLEEKVREILAPFTDGTHAEFYSPSMITVSRFDGNVRYHIYNDHIERVDKQPGCIHHDTYTIQEYRDRDGSQLGKAYIAIAALLTAQPESEQTLEEAVRGWVDGVDGARLESVEEHRVCVVMRSFRYWITADKVSSLHIDCGSGYTPDFESVESYLGGSPLSQEWTDAVRKIAALLSTRSTKPSYSDLEQRVEELEKDVKRLEGNIEDWRDECGNKSDRITDLEAQLQDYISPADHEAEIKKLNALVCELDKDRLAAVDAASRNLSWFHREYAKNAEASQ